MAESENGTLVFRGQSPAALSAAAESPENARLAESAQLNRFVNDALEGLSAIERAAFTLRHHEGRSIDEICRGWEGGTLAEFGDHVAKKYLGCEVGKAVSA
jgi:DNA-directed RNA polymerase specialized sigma24 family protein